MLFSPGWRANNRQGIVLAFFSVGLLLGGSVTAAVLWLLSGLTAPLPSITSTAAILGMAALGAAREAGLVRIPLPQNARQIPREVLELRLLAGPLQFGFELGTGVRTYLSASTPYVVALGLLFGNPPLLLTLLTGIAFGAGRALSAVSTYWARDPARNAVVAARTSMIKQVSAFVTLAALTIVHIPTGF